jgi:uncharacterized protein (TIGR03437 family)
MLRHLVFFSAAAVLSLSSAFAQLPDQTTLNGVYNVRYLGVNTQNTDTAVSFQGTMTFDGKGGFTVNGQGTTSGAALKYLTTGKYDIVSSGLLDIQNPFDPVASNFTYLYGGVGANGVIVASSTDTFYCDLFIAIPAATAASAATLSGTYRVASMEFLNGDFLSTRDAFLSMTADGKGGLGDLSVKGTAQNLRDAATTQTNPGATYTLTANGSGTLVIPAPTGVSAANTLLSGNKVLYVSKDGSFFVAGSATGYDMEIGVKSGGATALNGLYWFSYLENYVAGTNFDGVYSGQGSANEIAAANNLEIAQKREQPDCCYAYELSYSDSFPFDNTGIGSYSDSTYAIGANGDIAIGVGTGSLYLITVYLKAPAMTAPAGTTVFLNPQGVVNGANNVPITSQVAPGEVITLYGSGLGPASLVTAPTLPWLTTLAGVQVLINDKPAPIYYVSATQVSAIVPFDAPSNGNFIPVQVINNGSPSNKVYVYAGTSSPSLYTQDQSGVNAGKIQHLDGTAVTAANPAKAGETVVMAMNGLGAVDRTVNAGDAAPGTTLANLVQPFFVGLIDSSGNYQAAKVLFVGLYPGFAGLYQVNVTLPANLPKGEYPVDIYTSLDANDSPDSENTQATIFIG